MKKLSQNKNSNKNKCRTNIFQPSTNHKLKNSIRKILSINSVHQPNILTLVLIHKSGLHCNNFFLWMHKWENLNRLKQFYLHILFHEPNCANVELPNWVCKGPRLIWSRKFVFNSILLLQKELHYVMIWNRNAQSVLFLPKLFFSSNTCNFQHLSWLFTSSL